MTIIKSAIAFYFKTKKRMKDPKQPQQIGTAILTVSVVAAVCYPFTDFIGYRSVALILLMVVSVLAMRMRLSSVLIAAVVSALVWDFFFIPPKFTFSVGSGEDVLLLFMYFVVALLNGVINYRIRQFEQIKSQKEERENVIKLYNTLFNALSHELRTPIAAILGAADTLQENDTDLSVSQKKDLLSEISAGSLRLSEQVENLLNVSRLDAGTISPKKAWCDVADLIFGTVEKLKIEAKNHPVEISVPENFPLVQLDFGLTEQTLNNLLANAFRHTPDGTRVQVSAKILHEISGHFENTELTVEKVKPVNDTTKSRLHIEILDNGPGFPPDEIDHVFGKFYRPKNTICDGTGLGLFIVKGFTEAQGGTVFLTNRAGGGAKFILEFPTITLNQTVQHD